MAGTETPYHHGSHRRLLWPVDDPPSQAKVHAIIVPTIRPVAYLKEAGRLALLHGCPLVTLHSREQTSVQAAARYLDQAVDLIAIGIPDGAHLRKPAMETSRLLAGTIFERTTDVSAKRNLGLTLSHILDWERVVFLDDDIRVPDASDLSRAVGLLDAHTAVGLGVGGFPDNSVVCHAFREAGGRQETFIGAGALAVEVKGNRSFFPEVYNDDWFYVMDAGGRLKSVATIGQAVQKPYDPFWPERARAEELGDVLAEGVFWLFDQGKSATDGDLAHWWDFLQRRRRFIEHVLGMVNRAGAIASAKREHVEQALQAALARLALIKPELCLAYLRAWANDQNQWHDHIECLQPQLSREAAVKSLARISEIPLTWYIRRDGAVQDRPTATGGQHALQSVSPTTP